MAEPVNIRKPSYEEADLRALAKQIEQATKEFIQIVRRFQEKPSLINEINLGHFAESILKMSEATKAAKSLE